MKVLPVILGILLSADSALATPTHTFIKGSAGTATHQFKNPCKVSVQADPATSADRRFYLQPVNYVLACTAMPAPGWKAMQAEYKDASNQTVVIALGGVTTPAAFNIPIDLTGKTGQDIPLFRVLFATLRTEKSGLRPEYKEYISLLADVRADFATLDIDKNGLPDSWETKYFGQVGNDPNADADHDGLSNLKEFQDNLDPTNSDSDFDGVSDQQEQTDGTNPNDPDSFTPGRIAYFPFNTSDFISAEGQLPTSVPGVAPARPVAGFSGNAMHVDDLNQLLRYEWTRADGAPNYSFRHGSVRMWFKLDWTPAANAMSGYWSRLFDLGFFGSSQVALHFNAENPTFQFFQADSENHSFTTYGDFSSLGVVAGEWHQIVVTYSPTAQKLYLDGVLIANTVTWNNGVVATPGSTTWSYSPKAADFANFGLKFGSDGGQPLRGALDEAEFFNYELTPSNIQSQYTTAYATYAAGASVDLDGDGLTGAEEDNSGSNRNNPDNPAVKLNVSVLIQ